VTAQHADRLAATRAVKGFQKLQEESTAGGAVPGPALNEVGSHRLFPACWCVLRGENVSGREGSL